METEVEMSGQNVWDPWAEGMEIMMGKKCLTANKSRLIHEQHQNCFFQIKLTCIIQFFFFCFYLPFHLR